MTLSSHEESLITVVRALPPDEVVKVLGWARQLGDLANGRSAQWSDSWTDEDMADAKTAALRRFEVRGSGTGKPLKPGNVVVGHLRVPE